MENLTIKSPYAAFIFDRKGETQKGKEYGTLTIKIYYRGTHFTKSTGLKLKPSEWDSKRGAISNKVDNLQGKNRILNEVQERIQDIYDDHLKKRKDLTVARLKELIEVKNSDSFTEFLDSEVQRKNGAIGTYKGHLTTIKTFKIFKKTVLFEDVTPRLLDDYDRFLTKRKLCPNTRNKQFRHLRMFWNIAIKNELVQNYPFKSISLKDEPSDRAHLTETEFKTFATTDISSLCKASNTAQSVLDMYILGCITGMRISDILNLEIKNVQTTANNIGFQIKQQKTGTAQNIPFEALCNTLYPPYKDILKGYIQDAKDKNRKTVFKPTSVQNINVVIKKITLLAGIDKKLTCHTSRHTAAMLLLNEKNASLDIVSEILGHKSAKTTQIYAKMRPETLIKKIEALQNL